MKRRRLSFTTRYVLAFGLLMLIADIVLGMVILYETESSLKDLVNKNMLDVVSMTAELLDGDTLASLTEADVGGEAFREIEDRLIVFQNHDDIRYIYAVKKPMMAGLFLPLIRILLSPVFSVRRLLSRMPWFRQEMEPRLSTLPSPKTAGGTITVLSVLFLARMGTSRELSGLISMQTGTTGRLYSIR